MVFNTLTVGAAVTPSVIETYFSHYLNRGPLRQKPTAHISYHEGLRLIRQFLDHSAKHTIEDLQGFTAQWVPAPHWVRINDAEVAPKFLERAAKLIHAQLGNRGLDKIGGKTWWQWRRPDSPLRAEWIEMKKEHQERKRTGEKCERVILYVHGGAYYFGSVDEHRYQMQRHARKLKARVLAPRYRLAPQFPFPCGLYDCLATYYYLLEHFDPTQILFMGDSAGGGMVLSMLVTLRDQGQPLPAGTILLSPWCDLTHSFPSVAGDGSGDYIPPHGFHHRPSMAWPPPPSDGTMKPSGTYGQPSDAIELPATAGLDMKMRKKRRLTDDIEGDEEDGDSVQTPQNKTAQESVTALPLPQFGHPLSVLVDGQTHDMRDQIQMYTTNELLAHPLVSPVMQPSLGGLPPMLIQVGGGELLRDEQIYLAHKAADPKAYPPNEIIMKEFDPSRSCIERYPPTHVQLQVWDDLCHVPHTLSFTRPAKYMYRSVAQFGAWALSNAQSKGIDIQNDDAVSFISSGDEDEDDARSTVESIRKERSPKKSRIDAQEDAVGAVGKAGDPLPPFKEHMIRQRVTRHGNVFPLASRSELACLALDPVTIGIIKPGPVRKWLAVKVGNDQRFANEKKKVQKRREKELAAGYDDFPGESPPPTALVNRRRKGVAPEEKKRGKSWGLAMWSGWGSSHDEHTLQREQKTLERKDTLGSVETASQTQSNNNLLKVPTGSTRRQKKRRNSSVSMMTNQMPWTRDKDRPMSPYTQVNDTGQAAESYSSPVLSRSVTALRRQNSTGSSSVLTSRPVSAAADSPIPVDRQGHDAPIPTLITAFPDSEKVPGSENTYLSPSSSRPHNGVQAYPFKLNQDKSNPSIATLDSQAASGSNTPHSELAGDAPKTVELSGEKRSVENLKAVVSPSPTTGEDGPATAITDESEPQPAQTESTEVIISPVDGDINLVSKDEDVISPVEATPAPKTSRFKIRNTIFDPRVSMLGSIGADGMPNAYHQFSGAKSTASETKEDPAAPEEKAETSDENTLPLASASEASKSSGKPFKVRNPVFDARAPASTTPPAEDATTPPKELTQPAEAVKAAPFKLRHTYDPTVAAAPKSQSPERSFPAAQARSISGDNAPEVVRMSGSSTGTDQPPPAYESMPLTNVVLPEALASSRSVVREKDDKDDHDDDRPPTPPPKDDKPYMIRKTNKSSRKALGAGIRQASSGDGVSKGASKTAPMIGNLSFETDEQAEKRPQLESFVTASEGKGLQGS